MCCKHKWYLSLPAGFAADEPAVQGTWYRIEDGIVTKAQAMEESNISCWRRIISTGWIRTVMDSSFALLFTLLCAATILCQRRELTNTGSSVTRKNTTQVPKRMSYEIKALVHDKASRSHLCGSLALRWNKVRSSSWIIRVGACLHSCRSSDCCCTDMPSTGRTVLSTICILAVIWIDLSLYVRHSGWWVFELKSIGTKNRGHSDRVNSTAKPLTEASHNGHLDIQSVSVFSFDRGRSTVRHNPRIIVAF